MSYHNCPLCETKLVPWRSDKPYFYDTFLACPNEIEFPDSSVKNHYHERYDLIENTTKISLSKTIFMFIYPYRIITSGGYSAIDLVFKELNWVQYKPILHCKEVKPMKEDKMLERIKLLVLFS